MPPGAVVVSTMAMGTPTRKAMPADTPTITMVCQKALMNMSSSMGFSGAPAEHGHGVGAVLQHLQQCAYAAQRRARRQHEPALRAALDAVGPAVQQLHGPPQPPPQPAHP